MTLRKIFGDDRTKKIDTYGFQHFIKITYSDGISRNSRTDTLDKGWYVTVCIAGHRRRTFGPLTELASHEIVEDMEEWLENIVSAYDAAIELAVRGLDGYGPHASDK